MTERARVLVVEDEVAIREGVCDVLAFHGYAPTGIADGEAGLKEALEGRYDLLILDVMLPQVDGYTICRAARAQHPRQAILMLTARGGEADVLEGFRAGADDYVPKPFSVAQLVARIRALLRRSRAAAPRRFQLGEVVVDVDSQTISAGGRQAEVTARDVAVLAWFADATGRIVSRAELLVEVWGYQRVESVQTRCVDMHIAKLRRKLAQVCDTPLIETVRGAGYRHSGG